mgnify:CR=1 FL=1
MVIVVPSALSVQVRLSLSVCVHVTVPVSSALAVIPHEIICRVSVGKYSSVPAAMTAADDAELARLQAEAEAAEAALKLAQAKAALAAARAGATRLDPALQRPGRFGEVQVAPCGLLHKAKLVQVHVILQIKMLFIMLQMVYGISCRYGHGAQISAAMSASKAVTRGFSPIEGCRWM